MKKQELVRDLTRYADRHMATMRGQETLARYLAHYFSELNVLPDQRWDFWDIDHYIPQLLLGAFEVFRTSKDEAVVRFRVRYEDEVGNPMTDLTDIWGNGLDQALTVQGLGYMFKDAFDTGDWLTEKIDKVFNAERHLLTQVFYKFLDQVYRRGLYQITEESTQRGFSAKIGETILRSYIMAGRQMLSFVRSTEKGEHTVTFICGDDDPLGLGGGLQSVYADLQTCIAMINDVIAGWPVEHSAQLEVLTVDQNISIG